MMTQGALGTTSSTHLRRIERKGMLRLHFAAAYRAERRQLHPCPALQPASIFQHLPPACCCCPAQSPLALNPTTLPSTQ